MTDEQKLRQALTWTGGAAIAIGLVQLLLTATGPMTPHLWIVVGASFVGQIAALTAAAVIVRGLLRTQDVDATYARIRKVMPFGAFALLAALIIGVVIGTMQMTFMNGLVSASIGTILGLQGVAGIWIASRILTGKQI